MRTHRFLSWTGWISLSLRLIGHCNVFAYEPVDPAFAPHVNGPVYAITVQPDGKILIGGAFTMVAGVNRTNLARLEPDGTLDTNFVGWANATVYCIAVQPDGKILVGGDFTALSQATRNRIGRLNNDGSVDTQFNPGANERVYAIVPLLDGNILVGSRFTQIGGRARSRLARLDSTGRVDSRFNPGANNSVYTLAVQPDGKILVGGNFTSIAGVSRQRLARMNPNGSLDRDFVAWADDGVHALVMEPNGQILVGGRFTTLSGQASYGLGRLHPDGTLDSGFNPAPNGSVHSIVRRADGVVVIGGEFTTIAGAPLARLCWLRPDGTPVPDSTRPSVNGAVYALAADQDGRILAGGAFTELVWTGYAIPVTRTNLARLALLPADTPVDRVMANTTSILWRRCGPVPELWSAEFYCSTNGIEWVRIGSGTRTDRGWELGGVSLPENVRILARGYVSGGYHSASGAYWERFCVPAVINVQFSDMVGWWQAEGNGWDVIGGNDAVVPAEVGYTNGMVGLGFLMGGGPGRILVPDAPELNVGAGEDFTIEAWICAYPPPAGASSVMTIFSKRIPWPELGYELYLDSGRPALRIADTT